VLNRVPNVIIGNMVNFVFNHVFYPPRRFRGNPEALRLVDGTINNALIGDGFYGMGDIKLEGQNIHRIVPAPRTASMYNQKKDAKGQIALHVP